MFFPRWLELKEFFECRAGCARFGDRVLVLVLFQVVAGAWDSGSVRGVGAGVVCAPCVGARIGDLRL